ncbi:putative metalloendopeptidase [Calothrix parasitica NIES-267]|uniref:Putative metalloendopeptidase n=1 Tax=Calothrix parasitica NIES-267 TaxID=1973488 RepID=A0A1Z4M2F4_9CYAN|nr:putative metalloendopeptidase [Calothrix parasitica NIES-267]
MLLKSKLFVSALIALPIGVFSVEALTPAFKNIGTSSLSVNKNVPTRVVKAEQTNPPKESNSTSKSKTIKIAHRSRSGWRVPWLGATATVTQRWHSDSWGRYKSVDFGLPAGTPVVAPIASRVLSFCNAGGNHLAIRLKAADGNRYSLVHVKSRSVYVGRRYRRGQVIGVIAGNTPRNRCARSTGPHLHMSFPRQNFRLGRYWFSRSYIPKRLKP